MSYPQLVQSMGKVGVRLLNTGGLSESLINTAEEDGYIKDYGNIYYVTDKGKELINSMCSACRCDFQYLKRKHDGQNN